MGDCLRTGQPSTKVNLVIITISPHRLPVADSTPLSRSAHQSDSTWCSIWTTLSSISTLHAADVQWIPAHVRLEGNVAADHQAKRGSTLTQSTVPMDYSTAWATLTSKPHRHSDRHSRVQSSLTASTFISAGNVTGQRTSA